MARNLWLAASVFALNGTGWADPAPAHRPAVAWQQGRVFAVGTEAPEERGAHVREIEWPRLVVPMTDAEARKDTGPKLEIDGRRWRPARNDDALEPEHVRVVTVKRRIVPLRQGDTVAAGQLLALIDPELCHADLAIRAAKFAASQARATAVTRTKEEACKRWEAMQAAVRRVPGAVSMEELRAAELTYVRYAEEEKEAVALVNVARLELRRELLILERHEVRSPAAGTFVRVEVRPGEAVREFATVGWVRPAGAVPGGR